MTKQVTNRCRAPMHQRGCNRFSANKINTFLNVPPPRVYRNHNSRTIRARFLGCAPNARARLVCGVFASTIRGGMAPGFPRYYPAGCVREGSTNNRGRRKTCLRRGIAWLRGFGLVARLLVGVLEHLVAQAAGRITVASRTITTCTSSECTMTPEAPVDAAVDGRITAAYRTMTTRAANPATPAPRPMTDFGRSVTQAREHAGAFQTKGARYDR